MCIPGISGADFDNDEVNPSSGTHSPHYGEIQRDRQQWLVRRAQEIRNGGSRTGPISGVDEPEGTEGNDTAANGIAAHGSTDNLRRALANQKLRARNHIVRDDDFDGIITPTPKKDAGDKFSVEERTKRMEIGAELWGATYVPPIDPDRRKKLIEKWSGLTNAKGDENAPGDPQDGGDERGGNGADNCDNCNGDEAEDAVKGYSQGAQVRARLWKISSETLCTS